MKAGAEQVGAATFVSVPCHSIAKPLIRKDPIPSTARVFSFVTSNIRYGTPTGLYLIIEQVHAKPGMPSFGNTIGPSITQIYRVVLQIHDLHDTYLDGKPVTGRSLSPWQLVKGSLGIGISTRPNGARSVKLEYAGFTNLVQPLPALGDLISETLTKQRAFASRSPYIFGVDPLPAVMLHGNTRAVFLQRDGGLSPSTAIAKYNSTTRELVLLNTIEQVDRTLRELNAKLPVLQF